MVRRLHWRGFVPVAVVAIVLLGGVTLQATRSGVACDLPDHHPFSETFKVAKPKAGTMKESQALAKVTALGPGAATKGRGMLLTVSDETQPELGTRLAWVFVRTKPIHPTVVDDKVVPTTHVCGITVLDAASGEVLFAEDVSVDN
jgi:hypothetical protein